MLHFANQFRKQNWVRSVATPVQPKEMALLTSVKVPTDPENHGLSRPQVQSLFVEQEFILAEPMVVVYTQPIFTFISWHIYVELDVAGLYQS